jgi:hypothetical protein
MTKQRGLLDHRVGIRSEGGGDQPSADATLGGRLRLGPANPEGARPATADLSESLRQRTLRNSIAGIVAATDQRE